MYFKMIIIIAAAALLFSMPHFAENIFLKDGSIVRGKILSDTEETLTVMTPDQQTRDISRGSVMRILYSELYPGKAYLRKPDGTELTGYIVDEDNDGYTLRNELFSPEEFKLNREQVQILGYGYPSGLKGEAETDRVKLTWVPPYNDADRYRVYIRSAGDKTYSVAEETCSESIKIKNLKSNTKYFLAVTAIDDTGEESIMSSEIETTTKNIKPEAPGVLSIENRYSADRSTYTADLKWEAAGDPDGSVASYNIYRYDYGSEKLAGRSVANGFQVNDLLSGRYYLFSVKTVDDKNEESDDAAYALTLHPFITVAVCADYIIPEGDLGELLGWGYGSLLSAYKSDFLLLNFDAGVMAGYWSFSGRNETVASAYILPVMASLRYSIPVTWQFNIAASVNAGYWYKSIDYRRLNTATLKMETVNETELKPGVYASLTGNYKISESIKIFAGTGFGAVFGSAGRSDLITISAGVVYTYF